MIYKAVLFSLLFFLLAFDSSHAQTFNWVRAGYTLSGSATGDAQINGLTATGSSLTFSGKFEKSISFDTTTLTTAGTDALLGIFSTSGTLQTLQQSRTSPNGYHAGYAEAKGQCTDSNGNTYIAYIITSPTSFGQTVITESIPQLIVIKYSRAGAINWVRPISSTTDIQLGGIAVDANANCILALSFAGQLKVDNKLFTSSVDSQMAPDGLLLSLSSTGTFSWAEQLAGSIGQILMSVCVDEKNNIYTVGHFDDQIRFSPTVSFTKAGIGHLFIAKYDPTGVFKWARKMGGNDLDTIKDITYDNRNSIVICGSFGNIGAGIGTSSALFGNTTLYTTGTGGFADGFLAKYDTAGNYQWVRPFQGPGFEGGFAVTASKKGDFYVSGTAGIGSKFGSQIIMTGNGSDDGFVAKYTNEGIAQWVMAFGGPYPDYDAGLAIAYDERGHVYVGGSFMDRASFGSLYVVGRSNRYTPFVCQITDAQVLSTHPYQTNDKLLSLFPNPSAGLVNISWDNSLTTTELVIYDIVGKVVFNKVIRTGETTNQTNLDNLKRGVYVVCLKTQQQGILTKRLVLN